MKRIFPIALLALTTIAIAGDEPDNTPRTPAARGALAKLDQAREKARQEYQRAVAKAEDEAARELEKIKADVMKRGDLEEANRIAAAVEEIEGTNQTYTIRADAEWQPTLEVRQGDRISITASGKWNGAVDVPGKAVSGPDGAIHPIKKVLAYYLEGKISDGTPFKIGSSYEATVTASGTLSMRMNDDVPANNAGHLTVRVVRKR